MLYVSDTWMESLSSVLHVCAPLYRASWPQTTLANSLGEREHHSKNSKPMRNQCYSANEMMKSTSEPFNCVSVQANAYLRSL